MSIYCDDAIYIICVFHMSSIIIGHVCASLDTIDIEMGFVEPNIQTNLFIFILPYM